LYIFGVCIPFFATKNIQVHIVINFVTIRCLNEIHSKYVIVLIINGLIMRRSPLMTIIIIRRVAAQSNPREKPQKHHHGRRYDNIRRYAYMIHDAVPRVHIHTYMVRYTVYMHNIIEHIILLICAHATAVPTYLICPPRKNPFALLFRDLEIVYRLQTDYITEFSRPESRATGMNGQIGRSNVTVT